MIREFGFTYLDCQECREQAYCEQCGMQVEETLLRLESVRGVDVDIAAGHLSIETEGADDGEAVRALEEAGVVVQAAL